MISADKANKLRGLTTDEYSKLLTESISETYEITDKSSLNRINTQAKDIAKDLKLEERIEKHSHLIVHHFKRLQGQFSEHSKMLINQAEKK